MLFRNKVKNFIVGGCLMVFFINGQAISGWSCTCCLALFNYQQKADYLPVVSTTLQVAKNQGVADNAWLGKKSGNNLYYAASCTTSSSSAANMCAFQTVGGGWQPGAIGTTSCPTNMGNGGGVLCDTVHQTCSYIGGTSAGGWAPNGTTHNKSFITAHA